MSFPSAVTVITTVWLLSFALLIAPAVKLLPSSDDGVVVPFVFIE